ncbi:MAG: ferritin [Armatimonadetes bacterium]|nr:ferritin [Armatimonadota bacterium]
MISEKMNAAINEQINKELYSEYLYQSMAAWFEAEGLPGFANWMRVQAQEEHFHAMKFFDYVIETGGRVILEAIAKPPSEFGSPKGAFEATLEHENFITASINSLVDLAIELKDHATNNFLQWYVAEQVEEESNDKAILDQLKWIGDNGNALLMLDKELGTRVFTPPVSGEPAAG